MPARQPTVSAVIPVYNNGPYIGAAIASILNQQYPATEVIIVDDGSTDNTAAEVRPYIGSVKYIYQENRGEPAARNRGIREASGDYIAYLDGDDLWRADKLKLQMEYLRRHPDCALVYSDMSTFDERGVIDRSVREALGMSFAEGNIFRLLFKRPLFGSGTAVFRKDCIARVGYFDEELLIGSDYEMWLRIARHFDAGVVDHPLLMYRYHPGMSTLGNGKKMYNGTPWEAVVLQKILQRYPDALVQLGKSNVSRRIAKPYADSALTRFRQSDFNNARPLFRKAAAYSPINVRYWALYGATFLHPDQVSIVRRLYRKLALLRSAQAIRPSKVA